MEAWQKKISGRQEEVQGRREVTGWEDLEEVNNKRLGGQVSDAEKNRE